MSPEIIGLIGVLVLIVLLLAGVWIGVGMAIIAILGIAIPPDEVPTQLLIRNLIRCSSLGQVHEKDSPHVSAAH